MLRQAPMPINRVGAVDKDSGKLGIESWFEDIDFTQITSGGVTPKLSEMMVQGNLVVNRNASARTPGQIVRWSADSTYGPGRAIDGLLGEETGITITDRIDPTAWKIWNGGGVGLPVAAALDDIGAVGAFGTDAITLQSVDFGGTTAQAYARLQYKIPKDYIAGTNLTFRMYAGMLVLSDGTATADVVARTVVPTGAVGSDLVSTAAQSVNSLTYANKDFTIAGATLVPGTVLDIRIEVAGTDSGNAANNITIELAECSILYSGNGDTVSAAGIVSPYIPSAGAAQDETLWIVTRGPIYVQWDGSNNITDEGVRLVPTASGRCRPYVPATDHPSRVFGTSLQTKTTGSAGDLIRALVWFPYR